MDKAGGSEALAIWRHLYGDRRAMVLLGADKWGAFRREVIAL